MKKYLALSQASRALSAIFFVKEMKNKRKKAKIFIYIFPLRKVLSFSFLYFFLFHQLMSALTPTEQNVNKWFLFPVF